MENIHNESVSVIKKFWGLGCEEGEGKIWWIFVSFSYWVDRYLKDFFINWLGLEFHAEASKGDEGTMMPM